MRHAFPGAPACGLTSATFNTLFFVDHEVLTSDEILSSLKQGTIVKRLPRTGDALDAIASFVEIRTAPVDRIVILSHRSAGSLRLSGRDIDSTVLRDAGEAMSRIREILAPSAEIVLMSCATEANSVCRTFLRTLGIATGATIKAANADIGGIADWGAFAAATILVDEAALKGYCTA
ncbi:DUF4347 domain-containing protein [Nisaea sp.]|uniref:DUF4347 domain-containing protein n=1 Tax=Nisaea sp. TaxID=2024842 RepID=UPI003265E114